MDLYWACFHLLNFLANEQKLDVELKCLQPENCMYLVMQ